jgi:hypothetical protein
MLVSSKLTKDVSGKLWCIVAFVIKLPLFIIETKYFKELVRLLPIYPLKRTDFWCIVSLWNNYDWQTRLGVGIKAVGFNYWLSHFFQTLSYKYILNKSVYSSGKLRFYILDNVDIIYFESISLSNDAKFDFLSLDILYPIPQIIE